MKKLKNYLFDNDIFFKSNIDNDSTEISFFINGYNISIFFKENRKMIVALIYNDDILKTYYENDIDDILTHIAIYIKIAIECQQQQIAVDFI